MSFERISDSARQAEGIELRRERAIEARERAGAEVARKRAFLRQRELGAMALKGAAAAAAAEAEARIAIAMARTALAEAERTYEAAEQEVAAVAAEAERLGRTLNDYLGENAAALAVMEQVSPRAYGNDARGAAQRLQANRELAAAALRRLGIGGAVGGTASGLAGHVAPANPSTTSPTRPPATPTGVYTPPGMPDGFVMVPVSEIEDPDRVHSEADFATKEYLPDDLAWGIQQFEETILPALASGRTVEDLDAADRAAGRTGDRSLGATYRGFFADGKKLLVGARRLDGTREITNGQHRVWLAKRLGVTHLPATIK
jgi:hypothetical protein